MHSHVVLIHMGVHREQGAQREQSKHRACMWPAKPWRIGGPQAIRNAIASRSPYQAKGEFQRCPDTL